MSNRFPTNSTLASGGLRGYSSNDAQRALRGQDPRAAAVRSRANRDDLVSDLPSTLYGASSHVDMGSDGFQQRRLIDLQEHTQTEIHSRISLSKSPELNEWAPIRSNGKDTPHEITDDMISYPVPLATQQDPDIMNVTRVSYERNRVTYRFSHMGIGLEQNFSLHGTEEGIRDAVIKTRICALSFVKTLEVNVYFAMLRTNVLFYDKVNRKVRKFPSLDDVGGEVFRTYAALNHFHGLEHTIRYLTDIMSNNERVSAEDLANTWVFPSIIKMLRSLYPEADNYRGNGSPEEYKRMNSMKLGDYKHVDNIDRSRLLLDGPDDLKVYVSTTFELDNESRPRDLLMHLERRTETWILGTNAGPETVSDHRENIVGIFDYDERNYTMLTLPQVIDNSGRFNDDGELDMNTFTAFVNEQNGTDLESIRKIINDTRTTDRDGVDPFLIPEGETYRPVKTMSEMIGVNLSAEERKCYQSRFEYKIQERYPNIEQSFSTLLSIVRRLKEAGINQVFTRQILLAKRADGNKIDYPKYFDTEEEMTVRDDPDNPMFVGPMHENVRSTLPGGFCSLKGMRVLSRCVFLSEKLRDNLNVALDVFDRFYTVTKSLLEITESRDDLFDTIFCKGMHAVFKAYGNDEKHKSLIERTIGKLKVFKLENETEEQFQERAHLEFSVINDMVRYVNNNRTTFEIVPEQDGDVDARDIFLRFGIENRGYIPVAKLVFDGKDGENVMDETFASSIYKIFSTLGVTKKIFHTLFRNDLPMVISAVLFRQTIDRMGDCVGFRRNGESFLTYVGDMDALTENLGSRQKTVVQFRLRTGIACTNPYSTFLASNIYLDDIVEGGAVFLHKFRNNSAPGRPTESDYGSVLGLIVRTSDVLKENNTPKRKFWHLSGYMSKSSVSHIIQSATTAADQGNAFFASGFAYFGWLMEKQLRRPTNQATIMEKPIHTWSVRDNNDSDMCAIAPLGASLHFETATKCFEPSAGSTRVPRPVAGASFPYFNNLAFGMNLKGK